MRNFVQYHKVAAQGPLTVENGIFDAFTRKPVRGMIGNRIWLISGEKARGETTFRLHYWFVVDAIVEGDPNRLYGHDGRLLARPAVLNGHPWFPSFLAYNQNFSLGLRAISDSYLVELERIVGT